MVRWMSAKLDASNTRLGVLRGITSRGITHRRRNGSICVSQLTGVGLAALNPGGGATAAFQEAVTAIWPHRNPCVDNSSKAATPPRCGRLVIQRRAIVRFEQRPRATDMVRSSSHIYHRQGWQSFVDCERTGSKWDTNSTTLPAYFSPCKCRLTPGE